MSETERNYSAYLLRLWRDGQGQPWRASLEEARTGDSVTFANLALLFAFIEEQTSDEQGGQADRQT